MLNHYNLEQFSFHFSVHWLTQSLLTPNTVYLGLKYRCWQMSSGLAKTKNWTYVLTAAMMSWWMLHVSKLVVINKSSPYKQSSYSTQWQLQLPNFHEIHQISWCLCNQNMSIDFHVLAKYIDKLLFTLKYKESKTNIHSVKVTCSIMLDLSCSTCRLQRITLIFQKIQQYKRTLQF